MVWAVCAFLFSITPNNLIGWEWWAHVGHQTGTCTIVVVYSMYKNEYVRLDVNEYKINIYMTTTMTYMKVRSGTDGIELN